jgi:hypothetical protein
MDTIDRELVIERYRNRIEELGDTIARVEILPEA